MVLKKGKGKGKGKGKRKKKAPKFDTTREGTSVFGVLAGHLIRTPLGQEVMVVGVKYGNAQLKMDPILWCEHANGLQAPLSMAAGVPPRNQGYRLLSEYGHLASDLPTLEFSRDGAARTKRTSDRAASAPTFLATYHGEVDGSQAAEAGAGGAEDTERDDLAAAKMAAAREKLNEAKPVVGVKIENEEGEARIEVVKVYPGGAFEAAGVVGGGFVTHVNGHQVSTNDEFKLLVSQHRAGDVIEIRELTRDGVQGQRKVMIGGAGLTMEEVKELVRIAAGRFTEEDFLEDNDDV